MGYEDLKEMDSSIKNKAGKKPLLQRLKENRERMNVKKQEARRVYAEEYEKSKIQAIKKKARQEAFEKHRPTRKQKVDKILSGFENLGSFGAGLKPSTSRPKKTKHKQSKTKYVNIGGKAYPVAGSGKTKSSSPKSKNKSKKDPFDMDFDFDFDF